MAKITYGKKKTTEEVIDINNTQMDKLESFLERNIKQIVLFLAALLFLGIATYIAYTTYQSSINKKIALVSTEEVLANTVELTKKYSETAHTFPKMKDYILLTSAEKFFLLKDNASSIENLKATGGNFENLAKAMLFDLGENVDFGADNSELTLYRKALTDPSALIELKTLYPDSELIGLLENWSAK